MKNKNMTFRATLRVGIAVLAVSLFSAPPASSAFDLEKAREYFVKEDYPGTIKECENILAYKGYSRELDELYYILGLSYMKTENYLRASDIFEIIINEFRDSAFRDDAMLGLGDTYFLRGDYNAAQSQYKTFLEKEPLTRLKPAVYYRFAQICVNNGDQRGAREYLEKLKKEYPLSFESRMELIPAQDALSFTIQVGAFSKNDNAQNLCRILIGKGYKAYIEEASSGSGRTYKVRVGKLSSRFEAQQLERQLSNEGYPTKIFP